jgi:hypothetical protein
MDKLSMKINPKLKSDLIKYNIDLPTDRRTKSYKDIVKIYRTPELYKIYLQSKVEIAKIFKKTEDTKKKPRKKGKKTSKKSPRIFHLLGRKYCRSV